MRRSNLARLAAWLRPHGPGLAIALSCYVFGLVGGNVIGALELKYLVDAVDTSGWGLLTLFWGLFLVTTLVVPVLMALSVLLTGRYVERILYDIRARLFAGHVAGDARPPERGTRAASVVSAMINDANLLGEALTVHAPALSAAAVGVCTAAAIVAVWSPALVALVASFCLLVLAVNWGSARALKAAVARQQDRLAGVMASSSAAIGGHLVVKSLSAEKAWMAGFRRLVSRYLSAVRARGRAQAVITCTVAASSVLHRLVELVAGLLAAGGRLTVGTAPGIAQLASQVVSPATQLGANWSEFQGGVAAAERIQAVLEGGAESAQSCETPEIRGAETVPAPLAAAGDGKVHPAGLDLARLSYRYPGQEADAVACSLSVAAGRVVAVVGPSGCGKSTLLRLALGLHRGHRGEIMYVLDGQHVADPGSLDLSYCPQDLQLFRTSVRDNLELVIPGSAADGDVAPGGPGERQWYAGHGSRVCRVLAAFEMDKMVGELKAGWSTPVGELSGGQRQRVAVVRAFLRTASAIFLDEPTAHLDAGNEHVVYDAIREIRDWATVVVATHRVVNLDWVDRIVVMSGGRIVDDGSFSELVARAGLFRDLYQTQRRRPGS